ncbi:MAG: response regulator [Archangium sp.]|nr:response regulator [Archangium sp.]MBM4779873.1 response regulator [Archangiaceae bacterium]
MTIRALVVDDSLQLRRSVMYALQKLPQLVCVEAGDGAEALRKLRGSTFDIVLSDINMPVLDGLKLVAHIRQDASLAKLPIVMITTESAEADRERAMALGANAYLVKPVQASEVLETVKSLLGLP